MCPTLVIPKSYKIKYRGWNSTRFALEHYNSHDAVPWHTNVIINSRENPVLCSNNYCISRHWLKKILLLLQYKCGHITRFIYKLTPSTASNPVSRSSFLKMSRWHKLQSVTAVTFYWPWDLAFGDAATRHLLYHCFWITVNIRRDQCWSTSLLHPQYSSHPPPTLCANNIIIAFSVFMTRLVYIRMCIYTHGNKERSRSLIEVGSLQSGHPNKTTTARYMYTAVCGINIRLVYIEQG